MQLVTINKIRFYHGHLTTHFIELAASATIIKYWSAVLPDAAWSVIFLAIIIAINMFSVRVYGELEYWFALIKIAIVIVFIIMAILVTAGAVGGQGTIGFS